MKAIHKHAAIKNANLDRLTYGAGLLLPAMTLPQAYDVWVSHDIGGVSVLTWSLYAAVSLVFVMFGVRHREKLLIITYLPMFVVELAIISGLLFRLR